MQCANKILWLAGHRVYNQIIGNLDTPPEEITRYRRENVTPRFSPISCISTVIARRSAETDTDLSLDWSSIQDPIKTNLENLLHCENLRRATEKIFEGPEDSSRTKVSNIAYNLCLCRFQASMLKTTLESGCTYRHF